MSLKSLETKWKPALSSILEELTEPQFKKLLFCLDKIPQSVKEHKAREEMPQIIIQYYGVESSITTIDKAMAERIPRMDAVVQDLLRPCVDRLKQQKKKKSQQKNCRPVKTDPAGTLKRKQKEPLKSTQSIKIPKTDPAGTLKRKRKEPLKSTQSIKIPKTDPAGTLKRKQKEPLKSTQSIKIPKVQSAPVQTGRIKIVGIKTVNTRNTHLEVEFNQQRQIFIVTSQLLRKAFSFGPQDDVRDSLLAALPLSAEATIQGSKIKDIKQI